MSETTANNSEDQAVDATWTSKVSPDSVYAHLTSYYLYQDRLSWSRTQTLVVLEAAILAGSYAQVGTALAPAILLPGTFIVWLIWRLIKRDWQVRDHNLHLLDQVHQPKGIKMVVPASGNWSRGSFITPCIVYSLLVINGVLTLCYVLLACGVDNLSLKWLFGLD
jgi:hypothetical protein